MLFQKGDFFIAAHRLKHCTDADPRGLLEQCTTILGTVYTLNLSTDGLRQAVEHSSKA